MKCSLLIICIYLHCSPSFSIRTGDFPCPVFDIVLKRITIRGSIVGTRKDMEEAIGFASRGNLAHCTQLYWTHCEIWVVLQFSIVFWIQLEPFCDTILSEKVEGDWSLTAWSYPHPFFKDVVANIQTPSTRTPHYYTHVAQPTITLHHMSCTIVNILTLCGYSNKFDAIKLSPQAKWSALWSSPSWPISTLCSTDWGQAPSTAEWWSAWTHKPRLSVNSCSIQ